MTRDLLRNEQNFLGCLLRSPHEFWAINDVVAPDQFTVAHHRDLFGAIRDMSERGRQVSMSALLAHLPEEYEDAGPTIGILATLKENALEAGSATDYAPFIAERAASKRIDELGEWMRKEIRSGRRQAEEVAAAASIRLQEIMSVATPVRPRKLGEIASEVSRHAGSAQSGEVVSGLTTGLAPLDEILGLMLGGDLGFIIASQGDGKSALAAQIAMHAACAGRPVLFFQMEMSEEQMGARELAAASGIAVNQIHEGAFDAFQWESIVEAERSMREVPLYIVDTEEMTVRQMKAMALQMLRTVGLGMVVIDQLDKVKTEGKHRDRFERMAEATRELKKLAKFLKVPLIALAQRTRGAQRRDDPTPDILDADAPSIERDADWVIGLWRKENWLRRNKPDHRKESDVGNWETQMVQCKGMAEVICLKRRRGKAFEERKLRFDGATMRFQEP